MSWGGPSDASDLPHASDADADDGADAGPAGDGTLTWRQVWIESAQRIGSTQEARWIVQQASGLDGVDWANGLDERATVRRLARVDEMVRRRVAGEPLQYVLGAWAFRHLDLMIDRRVLIPRPETEHVVEIALALAADGVRPLIACDLGTGSGAIALSLAVELKGDVEVWAVDVSSDALDVMRANLAGIAGRAAARVRIAGGSWFEALPASLRGRIGLLVSNPPYIGADEELAPSVREWEPSRALVAGPTGLECIEEICAGAADWLTPGGRLVVEIGAGQGAGAAALAMAAGLVGVEVRPDLAGLDRVLLARRP